MVWTTDRAGPASASFLKGPGVSQSYTSTGELVSMWELVWYQYC